MKKSMMLLMLFCGVLLSAAELKVLAIGNSFSYSTKNELPKIVNSDPSCKLVLDVTSAMLGGCTLERHWNNHVKSEKDSTYTPYAGKKSTLRAALTKEKWDIVTIQQGSPRSWRMESYEPYIGNLIKLIKELAPTAEIMIQQTWSYNAVAHQFDPQNKWSWKVNGKQMTQKMMYDMLTECYTTYAKKYNLRMIPTGNAVQLYREAMGEKLISAEPADYKNFVKPQVPVTNDVAGSFAWRKDKKTGEEKLRTDAIHLNLRGQYLQSLVWYAFMFGKDPEKVTYKPQSMTEEEAALLKKCAKEAVSAKQ